MELKLQLGTTSSSPYSGSPTFDLIPFHVQAGQRPALGTYVLVEAGEPSLYHYGRIVQGVEENERADPSRLQQNQVYGVGDRNPRAGDNAPHVVRVMSIEVLGEVSVTGDRLVVKEPSALPQTGRRVWQLSPSMIPKLLGTPEDKARGLYIGQVESGGEQIEFLLPVDVLARHMAVLGKTGVGKSYAVGVVLEELVRLEVPVIAFDVLGDFEQATKELGGVNLQGGIDFKVPYSLIGEAEFVNFMPNMTKDQQEVLGAAYNKVYGEALEQLGTDGEVRIGIDRLAKEIATAADDFGQAQVGRNAQAKAKAAYQRSGVLSDQIGDWARQLGEKPVVNVFIGRQTQQERNLLVGAAARIIQTLRRRKLIPPCVMILDEAHFFLPSGGASTPSTVVIREMIRTARHDAIGIILVTQSPSSMDKQALLTCNTRLIFALDKDDLAVVAGMMDAPDEVIARIPRQARGMAIVTSGTDILRHSTSIRIRRRTTSEGAPTPNLVEEAQAWRAEKLKRR